MSPELGKTTLKRNPVLIDLALQGGGSHGAFTWGVLDRLLEEPWLRIDGISGTLAGAMNAAVLADGLAEGGADGARAALENFWRTVSRAAVLSPFRRGPLDVLLGRWTLDHSPIYVAIDLMSRLFSPYELNPGGSNPLVKFRQKRRLRTLGARADQTIRHSHQCAHRPRPCISKHRYYGGRATRFGLPSHHVPGYRNWRGELLERWRVRQPHDDAPGAGVTSKDTILVQINPVERQDTPRTARDI